MNVGRLKLKPRGTASATAGSGSKNSSISSLAEVSASSAQFTGPKAGTSGSKSSASSSGRSRHQSSVRFALEDEVIGSLSASSASVASSSASHNEDSLEIMEEIEAIDGSSKQDEDSSARDSSSVSEALPPLDIGAIKPTTSSQPTGADRKRQLFDIGDETDFVPSGSGGRGEFDIDELQLSADAIAQHFQPLSDGDESQGGSFKVTNKKKLLHQNNDVDSLDQILNEIESSEVEDLGKASNSENEEILTKSNPNLNQIVHKPKELSPLNEDDVLINNSKVSLNSLKKIQKQSAVHDNSGDNSLNTTNDISELARDTESDRVMSDNYDRSSQSEEQFRSKMSDLDAANSALKPAQTRSKSVEIPDAPGGSGGKAPFTSLGFIKSVDEENSKAKDLSSENDNSIDEILVSNHSIETSAAGPKMASLPEELFANEGEQHSTDSNISDSLREKILSSSKSFEEVKTQHDLEVPSDKTEDDKPVTVKQMEKVTDFKEALEDISEESENNLNNPNLIENKLSGEDEPGPSSAVIEKGKEIRKILEEKVLHKQLSIGSTIYEDNKENIPDSLSFNKSYDFDSVVSLNMFQAMTNEIKELRELITTKDIMLEGFSRRESLKDSTSIATNSTEYRPLNEDVVSSKELHNNINEQNQWIIVLAEKLQESNQARDRLEAEGLRLATEVNQLRKQVADNVEAIKQKVQWMPRDQESTGQRISEISIDLVSETDDALSDFPDLYEERSNRNSRERQLDIDLDIDYSDQNPLHPTTTLTKQLEQFRKYLIPEELRLFNMVQRKFDEYIKQELDKQKETHDDEIKIFQERLESEKSDHETEVSRLRQMLSNVKSGSTEVMDLRKELEARHQQEMTDLRTYYEKTCAELQKQYSEEVFSQHSRRMSDDTASDISDQEDFPEENGGYQSKHGSPKRKLKDDIYLSPTHRKITPTTIDTTEGSADEVMEVVVVESEKDSHLGPEELREFYQNKIRQLKLQHSEDTLQLRIRLKHFEEKEAGEKFMSNNNAQPVSQDVASHLTPTTAHETETESEKQSLGVLLTAANNRTLTNPTTSTTTTDAGTEPVDDLQEIIADYERRLQEQVALARQDVLHELEVQIQALLTDGITEDSHWPPELILLREKFTAKSQLEIAQIEIKHEQEMARLKTDFEKQLQWKLKRQTTFDSTRDFDQIISERDNLRELSSTLRNVLGELVKYVSICEDDLNNTVFDELQKHGILPESELPDVSTLDLNVSDVSTFSTRKFLKFTPDVSGLISIIEDPSFVEFVSKDAGQHEKFNQSLNLEECLDKLRCEAVQILKLSERLVKKPESKDEDLDKVSEKSDSCEEEDGLKRGTVKKENASTRSLDHAMGRKNSASENNQNSTTSLPTDLAAVQSSGELHILIHELRNEKQLLENKLADTLSKHNNLVVELNKTKNHLLEINSQRVEFREGYGTNALLPCAQKPPNSFIELQDKAKAFLESVSPDNTLDHSANLLQLVEDFCREGERYLEDGKRDKMDLQAQIDAADKQLKMTRQFLDEQAVEREQERDEFVKEIEKLKVQLREKDKDKVNFERVTKEDGFLCDNCSCDRDVQAIIGKLEAAEQQYKELSVQISDRDDRIRKLESDLKDSIDKGFTLREIITELETHVEGKSINEHVQEAKIKELEIYIDAQDRQKESLHQEMESLKADRGYEEKIAKLEEELRLSRPSLEQSMVLEALTVQLRDIEETLERKTKNLETLHSNSAASLVCSSPSEDISMNQESPLHRKKSSEASSLVGEKQNPPPLPVDEVQRIFDKLHRHSRIEEVAIKRINDLEMQIAGVRAEYSELQHERDVLQERMSEQSLKITTLQSKLDEQRVRAEELHRQGTSHLTVKVHDLQNELINLKETLQTRDKQITNLKNFLENSQQVIERQEKELAMNQANNDRSQYELKLEADLKAKCDEIQQLKHKIQHEMINKVALPDLMETMLADKNEEIDQLREKLIILQQASPPHPPQTGTAHGREDDNARTLSDIVSITDCDESDMVMRRMPPGQADSGLLAAANSIPMDTSMLSKEPAQTFNVTGASHSAAGENRFTPLMKPHTGAPLPKPTPFPCTGGAGSFEAPNFFPDLSSVLGGGFLSQPRPTPSQGSVNSPEFVPRQINFSLVEQSSSSGAGYREPAFIEEIYDDEGAEVLKASSEQGKRLSDISEHVTAEDRDKLENELESLKMSLDRVTNEKNEALERLQGEVQDKIDRISDLQVELAARNQLYEDLLQEKKDLKEELKKVKASLVELESVSEKLEKKEVELKDALEKLALKEGEVEDFNNSNSKIKEEMQQQLVESQGLRSDYQKSQFLLDTLKQQVESLNKTISHKDELLTKLEKDILNYSKNEEKYLEQLKVLDAKDTELKILQGNYKDRLHEIDILNEDNRFLNEDITRLKNEIAKSSSTSLPFNPSYVQFLKQNCEKFEEELDETKAMLTEKMLALERVKIDLSACQREAEDLRCMLKEKESMIQQIGVDGNNLHEALSGIQNKMQENNISLNKKLREEQERNAVLQSEVNKLKIQLQRSDNSSSPKPFSVEEIAEQIEKELNYSAQLDSSIMKAIESDDVNSEGELNKSNGKAQKSASNLDDIKQQLQMEIDNNGKLHEMLEQEKHNSNAIQMQDAEIIEAMRLRLEAAIDNESALQKLLAEEKNKNDRLSTLMAGVQRTKSFDNYLLMSTKSPQESPLRRLNRSNEFESEVVARYEGEIKFLSAQNERERERAVDLQRVLERERNRFEKEIADRNEHSERVKKELLRVTKEKDRLEVELDHEQEKQILAHKEIESLEKRISALQEAESMRSLRRTSGQNSLEFQELRLRLESVEQERNRLQEIVQSLQAEVDRRKLREAKLTEALSRENSAVDGNVPEQFLVKLRDLNSMLESNARENQRQAETLRMMIEERKALQKRIQELERYNVHNSHYNRDDLEERANHLFGKYLRSESHRKALVHQKRYLQIVLNTYEENESKALQLLAQNSPLSLQDCKLPENFYKSSDQTKQQRSSRKHSFRAVVTVVIAIERMKFIVRKWQGGRQVCAKAIFSQQFTPRRSQSATTNIWARSPNSHFVEYNSSPPARDRNSAFQTGQTYSGNYLRLPETQLLMNTDMRERLEEQYNRSNANR
ncbi:pericentrin isoform X2 [Uranotaenia lowii]|uniref:pericentrin isoform X2 n=1 Tax=Uranotaenia lowii TaxID=190385 RepID=UPI002479A55F|nr:pericentrin isoform X2 [Uranotaenia lowii]